MCGWETSGYMCTFVAYINCGLSVQIRAHVLRLNYLVASKAQMFLLCNKLLQLYWNNIGIICFEARKSISSSSYMLQLYCWSQAVGDKKSLIIKWNRFWHLLIKLSSSQFSYWTLLNLTTVWQKYYLATSTIFIIFLVSLYTKLRRRQLRRRPLRRSLARSEA